MTDDQWGILQKGEPSLGSVYGQEEIDIVNKTLLQSIDPNIGFWAQNETVDFEKKFADLCKSRHAVAVNGAGSGLDLVIRSLDIKKGDEIISCSLNFVGTHLSVIGSGAKLILCEPDQKTINIDPNDVQRKLTNKTRAIVATHMNGLAVDIDLLQKVTNNSPLYKKEKPKIIYDAARSIGTTYKGKHLGNESWATVFSLQSKKTITTLGEGGVITTNDDNLDTTLREYRSFGMGKNWGSNFKMTKIQAAVGMVQLEKLHKLVAMRRKLAEARNAILSQIDGLTIQTDTDYSKSSYYLYTIILPKNKEGKKRDELMTILRDKYQIATVVANPPTYKLNEYIKKYTSSQSLPIAEDLGERIVCLCIHPLLTKETNQYIIDSFLKTFEKIFKQ